MYYPFHTWSAMGYKINKGSKATWIDGVPMFTENQVTKVPPRKYVRQPKWIQADDDYDDPMTFDNWMGKH